MTPAELKSLRMRAEMTMTELAKRLGVSISLVSIWERGKAPIPPDRLREIKKICGNVENDISKSTDRSIKSTESIHEPVQVRMGQTVELGPETMKALKNLIETAVRQLRMMPISPEVIKDAKDGDRYRAKTQEVLGRGW